MTKKSTVEELLAKAKKPARTRKLAMAFHPFYKGTVQVIPKCAIRDPHDFIMHTRAQGITTFEVEV